MNDKYTGSDIHIKSPLLEKLDNFWFYYKIPVIVALVVAFILSVCIVQSCSKEKEDVSVMYAGPYLYSASEFGRVQGELNSVMPADFDGNGTFLQSSGYLDSSIITQEPTNLAGDLWYCVCGKLSAVFQVESFHRF